MIVYDIDVSAVLKSLWDHQLSKLQDPTGFSGYVPACQTDAQRNDALSKLNTAVVRAQKARRASIDGNTSDAFSWWSLLYDDAFPTYYR